ncbi:ADP-ribosylation factor-related protein 1 isoform X3 [Polistes fuscatus]|nr:ADP-ribosylation factor-related protein 1 isoform X3 [Polistes fuscatus]
MFINSKIGVQNAKSLSSNTIPTCVRAFRIDKRCNDLGTGLGGKATINLVTKERQIGQTYLEAAKTKFTKNYKGMNPSKITTTVGLNIGKIDIAGIRFNFWDLGGQEELQSLWDKYYAESHAVIYIVDSSDRDRIPDSKETFDRVISSEHLRGVPLLVLANKQDIPDCMGVREVKPIFNQNAHLIGRRDCMVMPVSAING